MSTDPESERAKQYDRAITLIQYYVQLMWLIFGAFLLAETVLIAAIASIAKDGPALLVFCGSILGLILAAPWWASFRYNHALYLLRMNQARTLEPAEATFFTTGKQLVDGASVEGVQISRLARALSPRRSCDFLIFVFALVFAALAVSYWPGFRLCS